MPGKNEAIDCYTQILSQHFAKHIGDRALVREMFLKDLEGSCDAMRDPRTSLGNLTREQAMIVHKIEHVAPEFLFAIFELHQIQKDLESTNLPESAELQKVADRIGSAIHEFLAVLDPATEEVQQADPIQR